MSNLRSYIYLDNYKMYSISSQLFEGLTEYIVTSKHEKQVESDQQKGKHFSGKILADILEFNSSQHEKKYLHDYSFNLLEKELTRKNKILELNQENIEDVLEDINSYSFVKIKGKVIFNDMLMLEKTMRNFNDLGESLGYVAHKDKYTEELTEAHQQIGNIKDRNQKARAKHLLKSKGAFNTYLEEIGLRMDPDFLKHMSNILDYGYNQQLEIQIPLIGPAETLKLFSAQLDRSKLLEDEYSIIKKYSRQSEKEFTLFGILTQQMSSSEKEASFKAFYEATQIADDDPSMKEAIMNIIGHLTSIENSFTGKLDYEYAIDPIALYVEI